MYFKFSMSLNEKTQVDVFSPTFCVLGLASSLTCNHCIHHEYSSHYSSLSSYLASISEIDSHCLEEGDDFQAVNNSFNYCSTDRLVAHGPETGYFH